MTRPDYRIQEQLDALPLTEDGLLPGTQAEELIEEAREEAIKDTLGAATLPMPATQTTSGTAVLRYPKNKIDVNSDYVVFEFYEYSPPFRKRNGSTTGEQSGRSIDYNQSYQYTKLDDKYKTIAMYMPEDISTGFKGNWGGKAFSNIGRDALRAAGADTLLDKLGGIGEGIQNAGDNLLNMTGAAAISKGISKITGDSITPNDVFGSISGAILNPNTELLFDSVDMRNFQLKFKLVPRGIEEVSDINDIVKQFKQATLPTRDPGVVFKRKNVGIANNFIGVPAVCRVSFMKGGTEHPVLPRFKMCAITQVDVNYTPDGSYATYHDGQPVAMTLAINFQETKLVFAEEIADDTIR